MPQVQPPPLPTDIELFAKAYFNIELTSKQLEIIAMMATGQVKITANLSARAYGKDVVQKVVYAYLQAGLTPYGRARLPQHPLPPHEKKIKGVTQHGKVLALIKRPGGAYNFELSRIALKYTSVISDLRKDGHDIIADRQYNKKGKPTNTWRYRLGGQ